MLKNNKNVVATTLKETGNVANEATGLERNQSEMTEQKEQVVRTTRIATIKGKELEIVVAHTEYAMEQPKDRRNLIGSLDKGKMLSCIYHLAMPQIFWDADVELLDESNQPIEKGTEKVYVLCPTADTYWRFAVDEKLENVEVHEFKDVQEYAQTIGCTNLYSRGLSHTEKMGVAALATGDKACKAAFEFAKKNKVNISAAKLYLDYSVKSSVIISMTMGNVPQTEVSLGRNEEDAEMLLEAITAKFGKNATKRYVIRAINPILRNAEYSMEQMLEAIENVTDSEKMVFEETKSGEKQSVISHTLTNYLRDIKQRGTRKEAA